MLTENDYEEIRKELKSSQRPLFLFHDDPDGLTSFLLLYKMVNRGNGVMVKSVPRVDERFLRTGQNPVYDKIFISDIAMVEQSFIDQVKKPVIWIDHHPPLERKGVKYFNPRSSDLKDNYPASYVCYKVNGNPENLWIAMTGVVGDWMIPEFAEEFGDKYPDLWGNGIKTPNQGMYDTKLGVLIKVFSFVQKGPVSDGMKCVKILTRIKDPYEILEQKTPGGKYLYRKFEKINVEYERALEFSKKSVSGSRFAVSVYEAETAYSGEVANEMLHLNPDKVILVGREKDGEIRMSLRGSGSNVILPRLKEALAEVDAFGGGHEYACGASVKKERFEEFVESFKKKF